MVICVLASRCLEVCMTQRGSWHMVKQVNCFTTQCSWYDHLAAAEHNVHQQPLLEVAAHTPTLLQEGQCLTC